MVKKTFKFQKLEAKTDRSQMIKILRNNIIIRNSSEKYACSLLLEANDFSASYIGCH